MRADAVPSKDGAASVEVAGEEPDALLMIPSAAHGHPDMDAAYDDAAGTVRLLVVVEQDGDGAGDRRACRSRVATASVPDPLAADRMLSRLALKRNVVQFEVEVSSR